ncbi:MAG: hypothetical protein PHZ24_10805 [Bacteroidales bacterium]|nr:hypothetical protein [Bacteroidales bacterium]
MSGIFEIFSICIELERNTPSYSSGMLWVKKIGYYQLNQTKVIADDWILILDKSIGIGQEKLLVILGVRSNQVDFTRPLRIQDMESIIVKSKKKWTGEDVFEELEKSKALLGKVVYATTDGSSLLKKALRLSEINHTYDVTHAIAIMLKKLYKKDANFIELTKLMGEMRLKLCCSKHAHIIPPNQRSKSRFLNIDILTDWGMKVLVTLEKDNLTKEEKELLQWVGNKKSFIEEMSQIIEIIEELSILLKNNGLSNNTKIKCSRILKKCKKTQRQNYFKCLFTEYLNTNSVLIGKHLKMLVCTSDIVETTFGKYKNELSKNPMNGITDLALIIPALTSNLLDDEIKKAIDSCTCKMLKEWKIENLCDSLSVKRKIALN